MKTISLSIFLIFFALSGDVFSQSEKHEIERKNNIEFAAPGGVSLLLDLYLPKGVKNPPLLMFIHGGGWKNGNRKGCKLSWVAEHGYAVASVEYRMSQEAVFPAQIHDCKGALRWLRANAAKYGYNADNVVVAGTSAGGHLAALMGTSGDVVKLEGTTGGNADQSSRVQGIIDYYGASDFVHRSTNQPSKTEEPSGSVFKLFGGKVTENLEVARSAGASTHVSKDDPPLLILHGENDKTVLIDQSEILRDSYKKAGLGVEMLTKKGAGHGWKGTSKQERKLVLGILKRCLASERR